MRALVKGVVAASLALAVLVGVFCFLISQDVAVKSGEVTLSSFTPNEINRIAVQNAEGGFEVVRTDDGYVVDDIPSEYVDLDGFVQFMTRAGAVTALRLVNEKPGDDGLYGLDAPLATCEIEYALGDTLALAFGAKDLVSGNYYMRANGKAPVYLAEAALAEGFLVKKTAYISRDVTPRLTVSSPLSAIRDVTFEGKKLDRPIEIYAVTGADEETKREAVSFGAVTHLVAGEGRYELDQTYGIEILGSLLDIRAREVLDYNLTDERYLGYGFASPDFTARFTLSDGTRAELKLLETEGGMLAHISGKNVVYLIDAPAFANVKYEKLMLRFFLSPLLLDVSGVTVAFEGKNYEIDYARASNAEQRAALNGQTVDIAAFQAFYRLLTSASADGAYIKGARPSGDALMTITYRYKDPLKRDDTLSLYPYTARRLLVEVNGESEFDIRESFYERVRQGVLNLETGAPIEENW